MTGIDALETARRWAARLVVVGLITGLLPLSFPATQAQAQTVGPPSNATARTGNEDESAVAINPNNIQQIAVMTNGVAGDAGLPLSISSDGGLTWTRTVFATGAGGDGRPVACCDPTLAWDAHGNLFVGYLQRTPRTIELYVTADLGANFTNLGPVDTGAASTLDQPTVVAGANSVWVTWRDDSNGISARGRSVTGALTFGAWGAEQDISTVGNFGDIAIGPNGEVMVVYQTPTGNEGPSTILVHTDADGLGAGGFGAAVNLGTTNVGGFDFLPAQPQRSVDSETGLAWDRSGGIRNGRVFLVYTDESPAESNDFDILVRFSDDNGANWSAPVRINDDAGTNSQMLPRIALDQTTGNVAVSFYDARGDTGGGPSATDIDGTANNDVTLFATWSADGGATWAANVAVADAPTDGYNFNGGQELGDYTGLDFHGGVFYPSWADSSNSTGDNPDGTRVSLDVYVAAVLPFDTAPKCDANGPYAAECGLTPVKLDGSASSDPGGGALTFAWTGPFNPSPAGGAMPTVVFGSPTGDKVVSLTVTDRDGETDSCQAVAKVQDTMAPFIEAPGDARAECTSPNGTPVNLGTPIVGDECDANPSISNDAPPLFPLGTTTVKWIATDADGNQGQDTQAVLVADTTPPQAFCNSPATITPQNAPISFTATATDTCGTADARIVNYDCYAFTKKGVRINKTYSCQVTFNGDTITVRDSGGVGDHIAWTIEATDENGNSTTKSCDLGVVNPNK
jgi:hypothetical protein